MDDFFDESSGKEMPTMSSFTPPSSPTRGMKQGRFLRM